MTALADILPTTLGAAIAALAVGLSSQADAPAAGGAGEGGAGPLPPAANAALRGPGLEKLGAARAGASGASRREADRRLRAASRPRAAGSLGLAKRCDHDGHPSATNAC